MYEQIILQLFIECEIKFHEEPVKPKVCNPNVGVEKTSTTYQAPIMHIDLNHDCQQCSANHFGTWQTGHLANWEPGKLGTWQTGHLANWAPGKLGTWQTRHLANSAPGKLGTWQTGHQANSAPGKLGTWQTGHQANWAPGKLGTWQTRHLANWAPGNLDTWQTGHLVNWAPGKLNTHVPTCTGSNTLRIFVCGIIPIMRLTCIY